MRRRGVRKETKIIISLLVAALATGTSLAWSLGFGWVPCDLCWYERICMYPLVPLCFIGLVRKDLFAAVHVLPFTIIGMFISLYHYLLQISPVLGNRITCQSVVPCQVPEFQWFGWITPPLLAFAAFLLITVVMSVKEKR